MQHQLSWKRSPFINERTYEPSASFSSLRSCLSHTIKQMHNKICISMTHGSPKPLPFLSTASPQRHGDFIRRGVNLVISLELKQRKASCLSGSLLAAHKISLWPSNIIPSLCLSPSLWTPLSPSPIYTAPDIFHLSSYLHKFFKFSIKVFWSTSYSTVVNHINKNMSETEVSLGFKEGRVVVRKFLARPQHEGVGAIVRRSIGR